jgi:Protein of unknown function (DUF3253)
MTSKKESCAISEAALRSEILQSLQRRERALSVCPSEVGRSITDDKGWRPLMPRIRQVLIGLIREQRVIVTRGTRVLSEHDLEGGTIRIRRGPRF